MTVSPMSETPRRANWCYLLIVVGIVTAVFTSVGVGNYQLNPYAYDDEAITWAGQGLVDGKNFANYDANVDLRALRKAQIERMTSTPDIVIFGGSRWQEARSELIPGHTVFNAFVSNDQVEDMMAIAYLLDKAGRLPKTMVLSLRFVSLQPVAERDTYDWKVWGPEYVAMAERLGISPHSYLSRAPVQQWSGTFNLPALFDRVEQLSTAKTAPMLTTEAQTDDLDIIAADGSLHYSRKSESKLTKKAVDKIVENQLTRQANTQPGIDPELVEVMGKLIDWLRGKGVRVMVVQTPYHPVFWSKIQGKPFSRTLHGLETVAVDLANKHGSIAGGHYDPAGYPACTPDQFTDHIHGKSACLADMFGQLPDLVVGARP